MLEDGCAEKKKPRTQRIKVLTTKELPWPLRQETGRCRIGLREYALVRQCSLDFSVSKLGRIQTSFSCLTRFCRICLLGQYWFWRLETTSRSSQEVLRERQQQASVL